MLPIFDHLQEENRRLRELHADLLAALRCVLQANLDIDAQRRIALDKARAAIAKAYRVDPCVSE